MFIAKNEDLIVLVKDTREELEQALQFMVYTSIEETEIEYTLYNGQYVTSDELQTKLIQQRVEEIKIQLEEIDNKSIRAMRDGDVEYLEKYKLEALQLREELRGLVNG